jgi:hypothetical protein
MHAKAIDQVIKLMEAGKVAFVGEWRGFAPETINYVNKQGKAASFARLVHTVEVGDGQRVEAIKVSSPVQDGVKPESVQVPFKRGQKVLVEVDGYEVDRGNKSIRAGSVALLMEG